MGREMREGLLSDTNITVISGAVSGCVATIAKQPIQRIKWIRQVSLDSSEAASAHYGSIVRSTVAKDGFLGFFRGSAGSILRNVPHSALVYSMYPHAERGMDRVLPADFGDGRSFAVRFGAGYVTLMAATLVTHPLDALRVRVAVNADVRQSLLAEVRAIVANEGVMVLYRGFMPTLIGAGPRGAVGFGIFETLKANTQDYDVAQKHKSLFKFLYGYAAGVLSESFVYPLDTVRRTMQAHGRKHQIGMVGWVGAFQQLMQRGGMPGLFRGLAMNLFKNPIGTAVSFSVNDAVKDALGYSVTASRRR